MDEKEAFYRNHVGAPKLEVTCLVLCLPLATLLGDEIKTLLRVPLQLEKRRDWWAAFCVELACDVWLHVALYMGLLPPHATCTTLSAALFTMYAWRGLLSSTAEACTAPGSMSGQAAAAATRIKECMAPSPRWLSSLRGVLMISTCVAILAVDFRAFPRAYAKAEVRGTGLMDVGVGAFMLAGGCTAAWRAAAAHAAAANTLVVGSGGKQTQGLEVPVSWLARAARRLWAGVVQGAPCWVLWAGRLASVKSLNYQEHVGEYGVHWNFFATVAVVASLARVAPASGWRLVAAAVAVTVAHQAALTLGGLGAWAASDARDPTSWASLNKEGLTSLPGFLAAYLWGSVLGWALHAVGTAALQTDNTRTGHAHASHAASTRPKSRSRSRPASAPRVRSRSRSRSRRRAGREQEQVQVPGSSRDVARGRRESRDQTQCSQIPAGSSQPVGMHAVWMVLGSLAVADGMLWWLVALLEAKVERVSRRTANAAYVVWIAALAVAVVGLLVLGQVMGSRGFQGQVTAPAVSRAMLPTFLAANLLTGAVNLYLGAGTLVVGDSAARAIVAVYMLCISFIAVVMAAQGGLKGMLKVVLRR